MTNELEARKVLASNFLRYAPEVLRIRPKGGAIVPFKINPAQMVVHEAAERQMRERGFVRLIILKARQLGMSTYIEGRLFWKVTHRYGARAFILTHHADATANLFSMAKRYHEQAPAFLVPTAGASSQRELAFPGLDSGYKVGTAGTEGIGRSDTIQYFHGSEVAFWPGGDSHASGVIQAIPREVGTEVWLESTANGLGGYFHEMCQEAMRGESDYELIFLPWFKDPAYQVDPKELLFDLQLDRDDIEYQELYGLTMAQMAWRATKVHELRSDWKFRQEYPASAEEAFVVAGGDSLIKSPVVMRARKTEVKDPVGAVIMGIDPAAGGQDATAIIRRKGRQAYGLEVIHEPDTMAIAGHVAVCIDTEKPDRVFIDKIGIGAGIYDRLIEMGYTQVVGVVSGGRPMNQERYYNIRAEIWGKMRDWLEDEPCDIPNDDALHADLCAPEYKYASERQLQIEKKMDMKKRGLKSPDRADALAFTFTYPVRQDDQRPRRDRYQRRGQQTSWMSA